MAWQQSLIFASQLQLRRRMTAKRFNPLFLVAFHFVAHAVGELLDLFSLFDDVHGEHIFIRLVHVLFQLGGQLQQFIGVFLERDLALLIGLFRHVPLHLRACIILWLLGWILR